MLTTLRDSYVVQLGDRQLPASVIRKAYNPEDGDQVRDRRELIRQRVERNSMQYWVVGGAYEGGYSVEGLAKVERENGGVYLGDVLVRPPFRRGLGRCLVHAAFKYGGFDPAGPASLDGFVGSEVNEWYERIGFTPQDTYSYLDIGERTLLMRGYRVSTRDGGIGRVIERLEAGSPTLARANPHYE